MIAPPCQTLHGQPKWARWALERSECGVWKVVRWSCEAGALDDLLRAMVRLLHVAPDELRVRRLVKRRNVYACNGYVRSYRRKHKEPA